MQTPEPTDAAGQPAPSELGATLRQLVNDGGRRTYNPGLVDLPAGARFAFAPAAERRQRVVVLHRGGMAPRAGVPNPPAPAPGPGVEPSLLTDRALALVLMLAGAAIGGFAAQLLQLLQVLR